jgi:hypothetical protein
LLNSHCSAAVAVNIELLNSGFSAAIAVEKENDETASNIDRLKYFIVIINIFFIPF